MARGPGKGKTNNPNGRPKGTPNKTTLEARELFNEVISGEVKNIKESLDRIRKEDHYKYMSVIEKLFGYVFPKKRDITSNDKPIQTPASLNITVDNSETAKTLKKLRDGAKAD